MEAYSSGQENLSKKHTPGHLDCPACNGARALIYRTLPADLLFPEAFDCWLSHRTLDAPDTLTDASYVSHHTMKDYKACARALSRFFGQLRLDQIHAGHLREYQRARAVCDQGVAKWERRAGANRIRKEIGLLLQILRAARLWGEDQERTFTQLRHVENDVPRAMSPEEQRQWLMTAASRPEWQFIYCYSILALRTTLSTNELRALRMADISLAAGTEIVQVRREGAKNKYRIRTVPLETPDIHWAVRRLIERARKLGASAPHHYLFPIAVSRIEYDPNRPMSESGLRKRWDEVRVAADLRWLRPYDLRHTAITRMAEAGTPIQVIMAFAGHMTLRMQQHYTAISMMAKRNWARTAWGEQLPPRKPVGRETGQSGNQDGYSGFDSFCIDRGFSA